MSVLDWFLAPPRGGSPPSGEPPGAVGVADTQGTGELPPVCAGGPLAVAVLGRAGTAEPVAVALASLLRRRERARAAVVGVLRAPPRGTDCDEAQTRALFAGRAAQRLAERLHVAGASSDARGRVVRIAPATAAALPQLRRAAVLGAPLATAVEVPRTPALDDWLAEQDLLLLMAEDPEAPLARLALADLARLGPQVIRVPPAASAAARALMLAGVTPRALRDPVAAALGSGAEAR